MLWKSLSNRPVRLEEQAIQVTGLIVWVERWITEEARSNRVNSVGGKVDHRGGPNTRNVKCFCCGNVGHKANDH